MSDEKWTDERVAWAAMTLLLVLSAALILWAVFG